MMTWGEFKRIVEKNSDIGIESIDDIEIEYIDISYPEKGEGCNSIVVNVIKGSLTVNH